MVPVQVGDENMVDFIIRDMETAQPVLRPLRAVYKKIPLKYIQYLSGGISMESGNGRAAPQYSQFKLHELLFFLGSTRHLLF
jgi:hypothetical protein